MNVQRMGSSISRTATTTWQSLLKLGFGLLYNQMAWSYDLVSWLVSRGQWRSWQQAALPYLRGPQILELAHGPGHMLIATSAAGFDVVGLDLSPFMGRLAKRRTDKAASRIALVQGDGRALPFRGQAFDSVLSTFPTEFLAHQETIDGLYGVLKPAGRLVVVPQAQLSGDTLLTRFIEWLYAITGQRPEDTVADHNGLWRVISERFRASGFVLTIEQVRLEGSMVTVVIAEKVL